MIIIGSTAIKHHFPEFNREPKDVDIILDKETVIPTWDGKRVEILKNPILLERYKNLNTTWITPDDLCTLKASHLMWDIKWEQHNWDLQFLLKQGCKIDHKLFYELYEFWNTYHSKNKRSDLKMSKEDFFNNAINYDEAEHDYLHTLINPVPIYTKVLKDGCEVELDETKFHKLTYEEKLEFTRQECYIMAYERYKHLNYREAYGRMLKRFILNHAPIWSLIFILENYVELHLPKYNFIEKIESGLRKVGKLSVT